MGNEHAEWMNWKRGKESLLVLVVGEVQSEMYERLFESEIYDRVNSLETKEWISGRTSR
jgi:hypothetical protein